MFYLHTFLAKKNPLGTVWIAAHLERKIKKHQLDEIDIPSYADYIMFPEVPIALRLSGHLLFGLVKIYSLKVKYLSQDCNRMVDDIRTAFTSVQVNLPVDADRAPFESVTLPSTLDLDAVDLELDGYQIDVSDNHRKTYDQITLQDQIPFESEQYVSIFINEDARIDSSPRFNISNPDAGPMEEDTLPPFEDELDELGTRNKNGASDRDLVTRYPMEDNVLPPFEHELENVATPTGNVVDGADNAPNNRMDTSAPSLNEGHFSDEPPEILRDAAAHNSQPDWGDTANDFASVHEQSVPSMSRNGNLSPIVEGLSVSGEASFPSIAHGKAPTPALADDLDFLNTGTSLGQRLSGVELQPSPAVVHVELQPSPAVNQNVKKKRKRRQYFDRSIVLTNAEINAQLHDSSELVCKRRKLPCSVLDVWRLSRSRKNEQIFYEPLFPGLCTKLQEVFERRFPRISESTSVGGSSGRMDEPEMDPVFPYMEMEPEQPRFATNADDITHELMQSSPGREELTPSNASKLGSVSDKGTIYKPDVLLPTVENPASAEPVRPELATPSLNLDEQLRLDDSNLREFPTMQNSADIEELSFLEASEASSGYALTEVGTMSATTRKVAHYLKGLSATAHTPDNQLGSLSLNRILEGKTRKQCARMFFETLVLKSYGLIDVQQEEAYGDIRISQTPAFSSIKF